MAVIGIDLGTSNSAAAVLRGGHPAPDTSAAGSDAKPTGSARDERVVDAEFKETE